MIAFILRVPAIRDRTLSVLVPLLCIAFSRSAPAGHDWPQWRGPDRTGVSSETGLLKSWPGGGPRLIWEIEGLGEGDSSPVTSGRSLLILGTRGNDSFLFCRDRATGDPLWERKLGRKRVNINNPGPSSTPVVDGDRVYALSGLGALICARLIDGELLWQLDLLRDLHGEENGWGFTESPLVEGGKLILSPGGREGTIVALDKTTGETLWRSRGMKERGSYASAIAADVGQLRVVIHFTRAAGVGVDAANGNLLWRYAAPANRTANASTPIFHDNSVFYSSDYGTGAGLLQLSPVDRRILTREAWFTRHMRNHFGGVVLIDGYLYGSSGSVLTCMDFDTGNPVWQDRSIGKASLTAADARLYLISEKGEVALVEATPDRYELHGSFNLENVTSAIRTAPIVSDGRMFVRNGSRLGSYDVRRPTE